MTEAGAWRSDTLELWERWPDEPPRAYAAFCQYRDLPPHQRSLSRCAVELYGERPPRPGKLALLKRWSATWRWQERVRAYDAHLDRVRLEARRAEAEELGRRQAREAQAVQRLALERLQRMDPAELSPSEVLDYFMEGCKLERIALGLPETIRHTTAEISGPGGRPIPSVVEVFYPIDERDPWAEAPPPPPLGR